MARPSSAVPKGVWIAVGVGGGVVLLILAVLIETRVVERQRRYTAARAQVDQMFKQRAAEEDAKPHVVRSHSEWTIEFPSMPKTVSVNPREPGAPPYWQTSRTIGNFSQGQGEQYLAIEYSRSIIELGNDQQIDTRINALINVTAGVDNGSGRILTTVEDLAAVLSRPRGDL